MNIEKRRKLELDYEKCVVCQKDDRKKKIVKKKTPESIAKLRNAINERHQLQDPTYKSFCERLNNISENVFQSQCVYHSECYKEVTNVTKLRRLSFKQSVSCDENQIESPKDNEFTDEEETPRKLTRSKPNFYNKKLCIICQKEGGILHQVAFLQTGKKMHTVAKALSDKEFFLRLNQIPHVEDAVANDVQYHLVCWVSPTGSPKNIDD